ncbi:lipopolysaccharide transport system permease protein [Dokdonella fugitiva]|uniref:Transport permease protein n=1 Tax=Dokdonella fugitiva TaxID=328517 RepID=A0A839EXZ1_9GAMM|nr:ABC transporter permease [Dokdonella fugitiva]MBA8887256.1 lipopolysaccharide transport system permease protein [Dokdonella fugitiva]
MRLHLVELVLFSTYAELRAEAARSYLGLIWWVLEPAMMMGAFWLVFDVILKTGGPDYVPFLLIGMTLWQWMKSCITHGGYAIWGSLPMVRQVRLPPLVFPLIAMLSDTVKFACIFVLLVAILWALGYPPNAAYWALPIVFAAIFLAAAGAGFVISALVPLVPDLRFVIEQVLMVVMFLSGVIFPLDKVPEHLRWVMALNPVAVVMDDARGILLHGQLPNWTGLSKVALISVVLCVVGLLFVQRLAPRFPKLAS